MFQLIEHTKNNVTGSTTQIDRDEFLKKVNKIQVWEWETILIGLITSLDEWWLAWRGGVPEWIALHWMNIWGSQDIYGAL